MNPERRPAGSVVEMRFAQRSYGSVDSDAARILGLTAFDRTGRGQTPFARSQRAQVAAAIC
jgi:hypothetical protein